MTARGFILNALILVTVISATKCESSKAKDKSYESAVSVEIGVGVLEGYSSVNMNSEQNNASYINNKSRMRGAVDLRRYGMVFQTKKTKTMPSPRPQYPITVYCRFVVAYCEEICNKVSDSYCDEFAGLPLCSKPIYEQLPSRCYRYCVDAYRYYRTGDVTHPDRWMWGDISRG